LTDQEIETLVLERKLLPDDYSASIELRTKRAHKEGEFSITGDEDHCFMVILRQSSFNVMDFSAILGYRLPKSNSIFRLKRYNGKSHEHTNILENERFYDFHIHIATERYQLQGPHEDLYAVPTDRFSNLTEAVHCLFDDCGFVFPRESQMQLF